MPHLSRRSAPTPRRHRCPTDRSIRYRRRAHASSRRLMRARHSRSSARITSSQEIRHRSAGEVAHRSARSRGFAGGVRARLTFSFPFVACPPARRDRTASQLLGNSCRSYLSKSSSTSCGVSSLIALGPASENSDRRGASDVTSGIQRRRRSGARSVPVSDRYACDFRP